MDGIQNYNYIDNDNKENKFNFRMEIMKIHPLKFILFLFIFLPLSLYVRKEKNYIETVKIDKIINFKHKTFYSFNKYYLSKYFKNYTRTDYFNITNIKFDYSRKFQLVKAEFSFAFYDGENNNVIPPPNLTLYQDIHAICHLEITNENIHLDSLANIEQNKYFKCVEFFNLGEKIKLGVKLYKKFILDDDEIYLEEYITYLFNERKFFPYHFIYENEDLFNPYSVNSIYEDWIKKMNSQKYNQELKTLREYTEYPYTTLKRYAVVFENKWFFRNIYNNYFCFCKGEECLKSKMDQNCKYLFYMHIIDKNRDLYNKTDYLFIDWLFADLSYIDIYPIFKKMLDEKLPVHYISERSNKTNIYPENYNAYNDSSFTFIHLNRDNCSINGDFMEKYLTLLLKLKVVCTARDLYYTGNLFYNINYITFIYVGHGVTYFKSFNLKNYKENPYRYYDKILVPPSEKIISFTKQFGFNDDEILKMNLPRWDYYIENNNNFNTNRSIFMMFAFRELEKEKEVSNDYVEGICNILNSQDLHYRLKKYNITLYFAVHYTTKMIVRTEFKKIINKYPFLQYVSEHKNISNILKQTNLVVTDFSSIIFDMIYRNKPYIMYIPERNLTEIQEIYKENYFLVLQSLINGTFPFENQYYTAEEAIKKIIHYIRHNFELEPNLKQFYDSFAFNHENNTTNKFIEYIKNLN